LKFFKRNTLHYYRGRQGGTEGASAPPGLKYQANSLYLRFLGPPVTHFAPKCTAICHFQTKNSKMFWEWGKHLSPLAFYTWKWSFDYECTL